MLKAAEFYKDFDWESLLSLKTPAPLAHALRASQIIDGGDGSQGGGREPSYDGESTTLKAIEKRFKTFMSAGGGGTERGNDRGGGAGVPMPTQKQKSTLAFV